MSSYDFVIEDHRVTELAPKLAENRENEMFNFMISLLEAQGMEIEHNDLAIGEALPTLQSDLDKYVTGLLYAALEEIDARIEQGITYDDVYNFFVQKFPSFETELAKALVAFARQKLTPAQFYTWNTFLYRFVYMYHQWRGAA